MRPTTRRILTATISAALVVTACSSGDDEAEPTTPTTEASTTTGPPETTAAPTTTTEPTPTTAAATTTTTPESTTTTTPPPPTTTQPPPTTNPGDPNWLEIVQGLFNTIHDLRENPDTEALSRLCFPGENTCWIEQGGEIERLVQEGWRIEGAPRPEVLSAVLIDDSTLGGSAVRVVTVEAELVRTDLSQAVIVDENGDTVQQLSSGTGETYVVRIQLIQDRDELWKATAFATVSE